MLSKREGYITAVAALAIVLFLLDRFALTPLLDRKAEAETERATLVSDLERAGLLFERKRQLVPQWNRMLEGGLGGDPADIESKILHALRDWSQEAGLTLSSVKPDRAVVRPGGSRRVGAEPMREITFQASGTGRMSAVVRFLWRLETASLPVRVTELQMGSRQEGADDLSLQIRLSALYLAEEITSLGRAEVLQGGHQ